MPDIHPPHGTKKGEWLVTNRQFCAFDARDRKTNEMRMSEMAATDEEKEDRTEIEGTKVDHHMHIQIGRSLRNSK